MARWVDTGKGAELAPHDRSTECPCTFQCKDRDGRDILVPRGVCERCKRFKLANMTGMLQAEASTAGSVWFLSLTYAPEHYGDGTFYYRHVSNMLKSLRHEYPGVRFFAVGEKGTLTQRNHWHLLLFFPGVEPLPNLRRGVKARPGRPAVPGELWKYWPWGFASFTLVKHWSPRDRARQCRYIAKYLMKDQGGSYATVRAHWSCRPVLGAQFLVNQARQYARVNEGKLRLPLYISFAGDRVKQGGALWRYPILGARRGHYIREYYREASSLYGAFWDGGGAEVMEKITRKDLLGAAEDLRLLGVDKDRALAAKLADADVPLSLSEKWASYDRKRERTETEDYRASYAGYSRWLEQRARPAVVEPSGDDTSACGPFGVVLDGC